jgi:hypothetical protein
MICYYCFQLTFALPFKVQAHQEGLKLNGTQKILFYTDVNLLDRYIYTTNKTTGALLLEVGLRANFERAKNMYMSGKQNTGQNYKIILNSILENVTNLEYPELTLLN